MKTFANFILSAVIIAIAILVLTFMLVPVASYSQVVITTNSDTTNYGAVLCINSTTEGILIPRLSAEQRDSIQAPANGTLIYCTTTNSFWYFHLVWREIGFSSSNMERTYVTYVEHINGNCLKLYYRTEYPDGTHYDWSEEQLPPCTN